MINPLPKDVAVTVCVSPKVLEYIVVAKVRDCDALENVKVAVELVAL